MILGAIEAVIMIIIMIAIGYLAARLGWASKAVSQFVSKLVINVTLPCTIVLSFLTYFTPQFMAESVLPIVASFVASFGLYCIAKLLCRCLHIQQGRKGTFIMLFCVSNSVFIGFPVAQAIFGDQGFIYAVLYFFSNTVLINTLGYTEISRDGKQQQEHMTGLLPSLKRLVNPAMISILISIVLVMLGLRADMLPDFVTKTLDYVGGITSPLSLIFVGMIFHQIGFKNLKMEKGLPWVMLGRFVIAPLLMLAVALLFGVDAYTTQVFVVQMGLPCMVQVVIMAELFDADSRYATKGMVLSTLISLVVIPIYVLLFSI